MSLSKKQIIYILFYRKKHIKRKINNEIFEIEYHHIANELIDNRRAIHERRNPYLGYYKLRSSAGKHLKLCM